MCKTRASLELHPSHSSTQYERSRVRALQYSYSTVSRVPENSVEKVKNDDNVQFIWCLIGSDWVEASADALLEMIVQWIKIRGFSYDSAG